MNTRLLYVLLAVQFIFAGALIFIGTEVRAKRRGDYLELTHRVTSGRAARAEFWKLAALLPDGADRSQVRALFGLPLQRANGIELEENGKRHTLAEEAWLYYPAATSTDVENPPPPLDRADVEKLSGPQECFVISFEQHGWASARFANVVHPVSAH